MKPAFDVVVIARNEAETLPRLVGSLKEFKERGGEIYVLDTGSTDGTPDKARSLGCNVTEVGDKFRLTIDEELAGKINKKFVVDGEEAVVKVGDSLFDFASARNFAASLSNQDMISMPDCDEIFTAFDIDAINKAIESGAQQLEYNFVFSHDQFGKSVIQFMHSKFYDKTKLSWVGIVHEILSGSATRVYLPEDIIHLEHYQNEKTNRTGYLRGLSVDCYLHPDNDRNSHYFAREMMYTGRYRSALQEFDRHIAMNGWDQERAQSKLFMGDCHRYLGEDSNAIKAWQEAFTMCPDRRAPLISLAEYYFNRGDYKHCAAYAAASLEIPKGNFYADVATHYTFTPHELLYVSKWWLGDREGSKLHWRKALEFEPNHPKFNHDRLFYEDSTLKIFTDKIKKGENFVFTKLGDGELLCLSGAVGNNCDAHPYSKDLADKLVDAFRRFSNRENVYIGEQRDFFSKEKEAFVKEYGLRFNWVDCNILLNRKGSCTPELHDFYKAIKESTRKKVFVGPKRLSGVASMLNADHITVPEINAFSEYYSILEAFKEMSGCIYLFSAGMMSKPLIEILSSENICIDLGSAFDPLFVGETRTNQETKEVLGQFYADLLS